MCWSSFNYYFKSINCIHLISTHFKTKNKYIPDFIISKSSIIKYPIPHPIFHIQTHQSIRWQYTIPNKQNRQQINIIIDCCHCYIYLNRMQITAQNFVKERKLLDQLANECQFIAFDIQFTGVTIETTDRNSIDQAPYQKYDKLKKVAQTYEIVQLGLTFYDDNTTLYPFTFYLFSSHKKNISLQTSCAKFNAANGVDWNKWITHGLNFIRMEDIKAVLEGSGSGSKNTFISRQTKQEILKKYQGMPEEMIGQKLIQKLKEILQMEIDSKGYLDIEWYQPYLKTIWLIFHAFNKEFGYPLTMTPIYKMDSEYLIKQFQIKNIGKQKGREERKQHLLGFTDFFQKIWSEPRVFIGHNCFLDLIYLYHNLVGKLPQDYFQFKLKLKQSNHQFYDTKLMGNFYPRHITNKQTSLRQIVKQIQTRYKQLPTLSCFANKYEPSSNSFHNAGFDSFQTCWIYCQMKNIQSQCYSVCCNKIVINNSFYYLTVDGEDSFLSNVNNFVTIQYLYPQYRSGFFTYIKSYLFQQNVLPYVKLHQASRQTYIELKNLQKSQKSQIYQILIQLIATLKEQYGYQVLRLGTFAVIIKRAQSKLICRVKKQKFESNDRKNSNNEAEQYQGQNQPNYEE